MLMAYTTPLSRFILTAGILFGFVSIAQPADPESMIIHYDRTADRLAVEVYHHTDERYRHYVNTYLVSVNGGTEQRFFQQGQTSSAVTLKNMRLRASPGDTISVTAICTQDGRLGGELILTDQFLEEQSGTYRVTIKEPDRYQDRLRDKASRHHGYPYRYKDRHHDHRRGRHHDRDSPDADAPTGHPAQAPAVERSRAEQHRQEVEQKINRRAYEAKFGPLKSAADGDADE